MLRHEFQNTFSIAADKCASHFFRQFFPVPAGRLFCRNGSESNNDGQQPKSVLSFSKEF